MEIGHAQKNFAPTASLWRPNITTSLKCPPPLGLNEAIASYQQALEERS